MTDVIVPDRGELLYLEDLHVGRRFTSGTHALDEAQIKAFAHAFDPQPFHLDEKAASQEPVRGACGKRLAHGSDHHAASGQRRPAHRRRHHRPRGEVAWPKATRSDDVLHVESEVVDAVSSRSRPDRGTVTVRSETRNQRGEVVFRATVKLLVPRRSKIDG